jgi:hypothetical protein
MSARIIPTGNRACSGVRDEDGVVVFAMPAALVRVDDGGFSCLLWAPASRGARSESASDLERLRHCRLALRNGMAEGFVLYSADATLPHEELLALRVIRAGREYWARWGNVARPGLPQQFACAARFAL